MDIKGSASSLPGPEVGNLGSSLWIQGGEDLQASMGPQSPLDEEVPRPGGSLLHLDPGLGPSSDLPQDDAASSPHGSMEEAVLVPSALFLEVGPGQVASVGWDLDAEFSFGAGSDPEEGEGKRFFGEEEHFGAFSGASVFLEDLASDEIALGSQRDLGSSWAGGLRKEEEKGEIGIEHDS